MNPLHFAVVVGINEYPAIGNLTAAHADAQEFYDWLVDTQGGAVPTANAHRILGTLPLGATAAQAQPTTDAIYAAFDACMAAAEDVANADWPQTRLYFYCAGHGIAPSSRDAALLAANVTPTTFGNHVSAESLLKFFSRVQLFREIVIFSDCCRKRTHRNVEPRPPYWSHADRANGPISKYLACAAVYGEQAFEELEGPPDQRRGHFTRALLAGLRGTPAAMDPHTHRVRDTLLGEFIQDHMRRSTPATHHAPLMAEFSAEGPVAIEFGPERTPETTPRYPVSIEVTDPNVVALEIFNGSGQLLLTLARSLETGAFQCELIPGLYEAAPPAGLLPAPDPAWFFRVTEKSTHVQY